VRGLRTHRNYCKDDPADGPRLVTAQQASAALVVALPASLALTSKLALWRPDDEISEETAAHAEQTRRENEKLVVTLEQQKLTAFGEQLRNVEAQLQRAKTDQALAQGVVETRENQLMLLDKRKAMELGRSSLREAQAGFDEKLSELNDTDEQQKECQARLHALLRNAGAEEIAEAALALQAQENDRAVPALLAES
jgi:DNA repair exonuclease SbcCD nuclease subunit